MSKYSFSVFFLGAAIWAAPPKTSSWSPVPEGTDEFAGTALDASKWYDKHPSWGGRSPSYFYAPNVSVADGNLLIRSTVDPNDASKVRSACVTSKTQFKYGYFETRIKASDISMTTAFWFQGKTTEIDVIENIGHTSKPGNEAVEKQMKMNTHYFPNGWANDVATPKDFIMATRARDEFHVYGIEWNADSLRFYHNDVMVFALSKPMFSETQTLFLDAETFVWQGLPTQESLKDNARNAFYVDWVRAWRRTGPPLAIQLKRGSKTMSQEIAKGRVDLEKFNLLGRAQCLFQRFYCGTRKDKATTRL